MEILRRTKGVNLYYDIPMQQESYVTEMLQNNSFKTILPAYLLRMGEDCTLSYRADGLQSFANRFGREAPDWNRIKVLVRDIAACIREMQDYLLPPEGLVLSIAYIFQEPGNERYRFIYSTCTEKGFSASMKHLFEEIMPLYSHENRDGVIRFYDLYGKFLDEQFTPAMLLQVVEDWDRGSVSGKKERIDHKDDYKSQESNIDDQFRGSTISDRLSKPSAVRENSNKPVEKNSSFPRWLIFLGIAAALAGAGAYFAFGSAAVKGIALGGVIYVVLIILYIHSRGEGEEVKEEKKVADTWQDRYNTGRNEVERKVNSPEHERREYNRSVKDQDTDVIIGGNWQEADSYSVQGDKRRNVDSCSAKNDDWRDADSGYMLMNNGNNMDTGYLVNDNGADSDMVNTVYGVTDVLRMQTGSFTRLVPAENSRLLPIPLNRGVCRIGRVPEENEYCIPSPGISRNHARISCGQGMVLLQDMHSTNGTYVNHERVRDDNTRELHYGDEVSFAGEKFYCV